MKDLLEKFKTILHDIKNIIFILEMNMKVIQQALVEGDTAKALKFTEKGMGQISRMRNVAEEREERVEIVGVCKTIRNFLEGMKIENVKISFDFQRGEKYIAIKPTNLYRIITNVFDNAVQHVRKDGNGEIHFEVSSSAKQVFLSIFNNGPKVDFMIVNGKETSSYIFNKGFSTSGGEGLGLHIVKSIVKEHNGFIKVTNPHTGGVKFTFVFDEQKAPE